MITKRAMNWAKKAREAKTPEMRSEYSRKAFVALFAHGNPDRKEFVEFSDGLEISGGTLWDLVFHLMYWQEE